MLFIGAGVGPVWAQDRPTMVRQSYQEAFGRPALDAEVTYWDGRRDWVSKDQLLKFHMEWLRGSDADQTTAVRAGYYGAGMAVPSDAMLDFWKKDLARTPRVVSVLANDIRAFTGKRSSLIDESYRLAMGRAASGDEVRYWQTRADWAGLSQMLEFHRGYIKSNASAVDEVVRHSYLNVFRREPLSGEKTFWKTEVAKGLLCRDVETAHRDWIQRNLQRIVTDTSMMKRITAAGLAVDTMGNIVKLAGSRPSGSNIVAAGGGNIVAAGGGNIVAAGGGNVVAPTGSYKLIGDGGGTLIGHDGATLISKGGAGARP
jgi:hypothetical protein